MRAFSQDGTPTRLSDQDVAKLREDDLPYRLTILQNAVHRIPARTMEDNQAFEAGAVAGRSLLAFLGVGYDPRSRTLRPARSYYKEADGFTDEIKAPDVGGTFVELETLSDTERDVLARFIHGVHKACAHFTWKSNHSLDVPTYQGAAALISFLFQEHINKVESGPRD
jgi:hypothetical protein